MASLAQVLGASARLEELYIMRGEPDRIADLRLYANTDPDVGEALGEASVYRPVSATCVFFMCL